MQTPSQNQHESERETRLAVRETHRRATLANEWIITWRHKFPDWVEQDLIVIERKLRKIMEQMGIEGGITEAEFLHPSTWEAIPEVTEAIIKIPSLDQ